MCFVANFSQVLVSNKLTGVEDGEVGASFSEIFLQGLEGSPDEHLLHEEGVVGAAGNDASLDPVILVPAGVAVDHKELHE